MIKKLIRYDHNKEDVSSTSSIHVTCFKAIEIQPSFRLTGVSQASQITTLKAQRPGQVLSHLATKDTWVEKQQHLMKIADKNQIKRLTEAKTKIEQLDLEYKKFKNDDVKTRLNVAHEQLKKIENEIDKLSIKSPVKGYYSESFVEVGDSVNEGDKLGTITQLNPLKIILHASANETKFLKIGQNAKIKFGSYKEEYEGNISFIASQIDIKSHTFLIEVMMDNPKDIAAEKICHVKFLKEKEKFQKIPASAFILNHEGILGVMIIESTSKAQFCSTPFYDMEDEFILVKGLPDEVYVITTGADDIKPGQVIQIDEIIK